MMLTLHKVLTPTALALVLFACDNTTEPEPEPLLPITAPQERFTGDLTASRSSFAALAAGNNDTYTYDRLSQSWTGWATHTQISVAGGVVVARDTDTYSDYPMRVVDAAGSYREQGNDVGTHQAGHDAKTLPELYDECEQTVLTQDPAQNDITLMFFANGVLATCTYYPHGCADDCVSGIVINSIQIP